MAVRMGSAPTVIGADNAALENGEEILRIDVAHHIRVS
jgi:hypothetical protein